ncbi:MAG: helix-turn-helix domain-containing protein [Defluviitaleaceae bacterium]|nr:helix-turn-helix domain-containing protein [Defluviitaleaceae bacterium]
MQKTILLNELFALNNDNIAQIEIVRGKLLSYIQLNGDDTQVKNALQIVEIWLSESNNNDFDVSCDLADPILRNLLKDESKWDINDIKTLAIVIDCVGTYNEVYELSQKLLTKLESYSYEERYENTKLAIYMNASSRFLRAKYFDTDDLVPSEQLEATFNEYFDEAMKISVALNLQTHQAALHVRKGLFYQDDDLISRGFYRLKELGEDEVFRMLKDDASEYSFFEGIKMGRNQGNKIVGGNIRKKRNEIGMSMRELAEATGFSLSFISCVENGLRVKSFGGYEMHKISTALNVSADSLFEGLDERI